MLEASQAPLKEEATDTGLTAVACFLIQDWHHNPIKSSTNCQIAGAARFVEGLVIWYWSWNYNNNGKDC